MYNFEEIKRALEPFKGSIEGGIFSCIGNDSPDTFDTIYNKDGVLIMHNNCYDYLDVVGLSEEHLNEVCEMCRFDWEAEYARLERASAESELIQDAKTINQVISFMTAYFTNEISENELVDLLMSVSGNNKYVKEHILNIITDN